MGEINSLRLCERDGPEARRGCEVGVKLGTSNKRVQRRPLIESRIKI